MPYAYLDDVATADVAFLAWGETLEELFIAAADATMNAMVTDLESISPSLTQGIVLESEALDLLLFDLLQEIIFLKDAEGLLLRVSRIEFMRTENAFRLVATARGEEIDPGKHEFVVDVKAVTLYRYRLEETPRGWEATVILDV
ncbi:MAG: archease [Deltaproteobacteria bacterium]|nr:archease [Deltaproteobacteria bacterium]